jgi:hypothetical protein
MKTATITTPETLTASNEPILPSVGKLAASLFELPQWSAFAGEAGAFVARSLDGLTEAIAEPIQGGWQFWLVSVCDGETLHTEILCAS